MMTIMMIIAPDTPLPVYTLILTEMVMVIPLAPGKSQFHIAIIRCCLVNPIPQTWIVTWEISPLNPVQQKFVMDWIMIAMARLMKVLLDHFGIWMRMGMGMVIQVNHTFLTRAA